MGDKSDRLEELVAACATIREQAKEIERLQREVDEFIDYLLSERDRWEGVNADRYWQTTRMLVFIERKFGRVRS
jgi:hypothetical protein